MLEVSCKSSSDGVHRPSRLLYTITIVILTLCSLLVHCHLILPIRPEPHPLNAIYRYQGDHVYRLQPGGMTWPITIDTGELSSDGICGSLFREQLAIGTNDDGQSGLSGSSSIEIPNDQTRVISAWAQRRTLSIRSAKFVCIDTSNAGRQLDRVLPNGERGCPLSYTFKTIGLWQLVCPMSKTLSLKMSDHPWFDRDEDIEPICLPELRAPLRRAIGYSREILRRQAECVGFVKGLSHQIQAQVSDCITSANMAALDVHPPGVRTPMRPRGMAWVYRHQDASRVIPANDPLESAYIEVFEISALAGAVRQRVAKAWSTSSLSFDAKVGSRYKACVHVPLQDAPSFEIDLSLRIAQIDDRN